MQKLKKSRSASTATVTAKSQQPLTKKIDKKTKRSKQKPKQPKPVAESSSPGVAVESFHNRLMVDLTAAVDLPHELCRKKGRQVRSGENILFPLPMKERHAHWFCQLLVSGTVKSVYSYAQL